MVLGWFRHPTLKATGQGLSRLEETMNDDEILHNLKYIRDHAGNSLALQVIDHAIETLQEFSEEIK
jgi:hypothetical protein